MKLHNFFINMDLDPNQSRISLTDFSVIHQIKNVLRLREGDQLNILDNYGRKYHCEITDFLKDKIDLKVLEVRPPVEMKMKLILAPAILKKDKFEWVLQKCTEIGVDSFYPIISDRTEKLKLNLERAKKIMTEAAEQSERSNIPILAEPDDLSNFIMKYDDWDIFALDCCETQNNVSQIENLKQAIVLVGPEGGWSDDDREVMRFHGVKFISLGGQILRAETSSVAISSLLLLG